MCSASSLTNNDSTGTTPASTVDGTPTVDQIGLTTHVDAVGHVSSERPSRRTKISSLAPFEARDIVSILSREHLVGTGLFTYALAYNDNVFTLEAPSCFANVSNIINKISNFAFYRADLKITIKVIGSAFHAGLLVAGFLPASALASPPHIEQLMWCNPHFVDIGVPKTVSFTVPFVSPNGASRINTSFVAGGKNMAQMWLKVLHPLRFFGDAAPAPVSVQIYASLENVELFGDIASGLNPAMVLPIAPVPNRSLKIKGQSHQEAMLKTKDIFSSVGDVLPSATKLIGDVISATGINNILPITLTRPVDPRPTTIISTDTFAPLTGAAGLYPGRSVLHHQNTLVPKLSPSEFGDDTPFETFQDIARRPGLILNFSIPTSATAGTILATVPVTPAFHNITTNGNYFIQPLGWTSQMFSAWRGGIKYAITSTGSQSNPATIGVVFVPLESAIPSSLNILTNQGDFVGRIITLFGSTTTTFTIPYMNDAPALLMTDLGPDASDQSCSGYLLFYLINPIPTNTAGASASMYVSVFSSAAEDMVFYGPTSRDVPAGFTWVNSFAGEEFNKTYVGNTFNSTLAPYGQSLGELWAKSDFAAIDNALSVCDNHDTAEIVTSFSEVCSKFRFLGARLGASSWYNMVPPIGPADLTPAGVVFTRSLIPRVGAVFRFYRGSYYYSLPGADGGYAVPIWLSYSTAQYDYLCNRPDLTGTTVDDSFTVVGKHLVIPWYSPFGKFAPNQTANVPPSFDQLTHLAIRSRTDATSGVYSALGDDFQFGGLCFPPVLNRNVT